MESMRRVASINRVGKCKKQVPYTLHVKYVVHKFEKRDKNKNKKLYRCLELCIDVLQKTFPWTVCLNPMLASSSLDVFYYRGCTPKTFMVVSIFVIFLYKKGWLQCWM